MGTESESLAPAPQTAFSTPSARPGTLGGFGLLRDVQVEVTLEIGRKRMKIADVLKLTTGQTIELAKAAGDPIDIFVNGQRLGRGEAVVVGDRYGVRVTEICQPEGWGDR
jgi:flagellar motor switch protein FliN/FliY